MNTLNDKLKNAYHGEMVEVPLDYKIIHLKEDNALKLSRLVLEWWEIHKNDMYLSEPEFVALAKELING